MSKSLIDPPVTCFSPSREIAAWLETLMQMQRDEDVDREIANAREWLEFAKELDREQQTS